MRSQRLHFINVGIIPELAIGKAALQEVIMVKFVSAVIAAAAFAGVLTLLWATGMRLAARPAGDAPPQSTPVTQTTPALGGATIEEVVRDLAVMRNSIDELAAKQEQMAQNIAALQAAEQDIIQKIATLQAAEQDIIQTSSSPTLSGPVSPPPRKKAQRVAPRKLAVQSPSMPPPAFAPQ
jgi:hypothetical protein